MDPTVTDGGVKAILDNLNVPVSIKMEHYNGNVKKIHHVLRRVGKIFTKLRNRIKI